MRLNRPFWVLVHRWAGLMLALFLVVVALTGSLLAFREELEHLLAPEMYRIPAATRTADPLPATSLRHRVIANLQADYPGATTNYVKLHHARGVSSLFYVEAPAGYVGPRYAADEIQVDPATGTILGGRRYGDLSQGARNIMPFVFSLHDSLAIGTVGTWLLGIIALIWTIDCFVGAYLTFPARTQGDRRSAAGWGRRWRKAWALRYRAGGYKLTFDLHRAGGLWVWAMLFVFAWSSVSLNLRSVYDPVTKALFGYASGYRDLPTLAVPRTEPRIDFDHALAIGQRPAAHVATRAGTTITQFNRLSYHPDMGAYYLIADTNRDVTADGGGMTLWFDGDNAHLLVATVPGDQAAGNTITAWLRALHMGRVFGLPYRVFVCAMGLAIAMLSITGVLIWLTKRSARTAKHRTLARFPAMAASGLERSSTA